MNDLILIDSCQAYLPMLRIRLEHRVDTGVVIDSEPHLSRTCKTSLVFAPLAVGVLHWLFRFPVLHSNITVNAITY